MCYISWLQGCDKLLKSNNLQKVRLKSVEDTVPDAQCVVQSGKWNNELFLSSLQCWHIDQWIRLHILNYHSSHTHTHTCTSTIGSGIWGKFSRPQALENSSSITSSPFVICFCNRRSVKSGKRQIFQRESVSWLLSHVSGYSGLRSSFIPQVWLDAVQTWVLHNRMETEPNIY